MEADVPDVDTVEQAVDEDLVHTIDLWFSERRGVWVIERLDAAGDLIGAAHCCDHEDDAAACLQEWMRSHGDVRFFAPGPARRRPAPPRRHAA